MHEDSATRAEVLLPLFVAVARVADWNATWASCDARSAVATDAEEGSRAMLLGLGVVVFAQVSCHGAVPSLAHLAGCRKAGHQSSGVQPP